MIFKDYIQAGSENISVEDLKMLADSPIRAVRRRVAENERTSHEVLKSLATDSSSAVRMAVALNKSTPAETVFQLAGDEHPDVRFMMASTSYLPKELLVRLTEDKNPHVSQRAKVMLDGLTSNEKRMITVFEFLSEDHGMLQEQLEELINNYSEWTHEKVFKESVDVIDGLSRHLDRQQRLCLDWIEHCNSNSEQLNDTLQNCTADRQLLKDQISSLLMQHVDGPDFKVSLNKLLDQLKKHIVYSESALFVDMKEQLPQKDLDAINKRLSESLLRREPV